MNPQLSALLNNKPALFGVAAAGAVGLGLWTKKKKAAAGTTSAGSVSAIPGTLPAAAVAAPGSIGGSYDSSAFDAYNALQPELEQILQTQGKGVTTAPTPVASSLLSPTYSGNYVRFADGQIDEVESDGSLLWLNQSENNQAFSGPWQYGKYDQLVQNAPASGVYNTGSNLIGKATGKTAGS